jgi:hypothetical protein
VVFEGENFHDEGEFRPHYWALLESMQNAELWDDVAVAASVKVLFDAGVLFTPNVFDEEGKLKPDPTFDEMKPDLVRYLMSHLARVIDDANSLHPTDDAIRDAAVLFVRSQTEPQPWSLSIPLINLSSEVVPLTFGRLILMSLTDEEKNGLWETGSMQVEMIRLLDLLRACLKLRYSGVHAKPVNLGTLAVGPLEHELRVEAEHVVTALRLLKGGDVGAPIYVHVEANTPTRMGNQVLFLTDDSLTPEKYELNASEVPRVQETFAALRAADANGTLRSLDVALRRFNQSYARRFPDDEVIDFAIAFESTILQDVEHELGYRLALRTAALLRDEYEPAETQRFMKWFYTVRSRVVHAGMPLHVVLKKTKGPGLTEPTPQADFVQRIANLLRAALRAYVRAAASARSVADVNAELDACIVAGIMPTDALTH